MARQALADTFRLLEAAAAASERCPMSRENGGSIEKGNVAQLARDGRISVEVYGQNFRRVTILDGPHAGKSTAPNPNPNARPYLTIDKSGTFRNGKRIDSNPQPSAPRPLSRRELA